MAFGKTRCDTCGADFQTEAVLADHAKTHSSDPAEQQAALDRQNERKP